MYKLKGDPAQIEMIAFSSDYCDTPKKISQLAKSYKIILDQTGECVIDHSVLVKDLSLTVKGPQEDKVFA